MKNFRTGAAALKVITIIIIIITCLIYYPYLTPKALQAFLREHSFSAPATFVLLCTLRPLLFFLPSMGLTIVAGILFGALWGTLYVSIGGAFSAITGYYFARWLGRDLVERLSIAHDRIGRLDRWAREQGGHAVLSMRLFNMPWDVVSYWAGLSGIRFRDFYRASMIPLIPVSFLYTYFGSRIFTPTSTGFIVALVIMFIMGALPYLRERWRKRRDG